MAKIKPLFKFIAVLNAVLLFGAYVCYRGGIVRAFGSEPAAGTIQENSPPNETEYSTTATPSNSSEPLPATANEQTRTEIMPGPKSSPFVFENEHKPDPKVIMSGSKSLSSSPVIWDTNSGRTWQSKSATAPAALYSDMKEVTPAHAQAPASAPRSVIMSGSKEDTIIFESGNQPATSTSNKSATVPAQQSAVRQQTAPQKRVIMGGSKSARVEFVDTPPQTTEKQQTAEKPAPRKRVMMGGSKSAPVAIQPEDNSKP